MARADQLGWRWDMGDSDSAVGVPLWKTLFFLKITTTEGANSVTDIHVLSSVQL